MQISVVGDGTRAHTSCPGADVAISGARAASMSRQLLVLNPAAVTRALQPTLLSA